MKQFTVFVFLSVTLGFQAINAQSFAAMEFEDEPLEQAYEMAWEGKIQSAKKILTSTEKPPSDSKEKNYLLASTYSWSGQYDKARQILNQLISNDKKDRDVWIAAVKNELYAKEHHIALGLANKALKNLKTDTELERLKLLALAGITNKKYAEKGWFNTDGTATSKAIQKRAKQNKETKDKKVNQGDAQKTVATKTEKKDDIPKNRIGINNAFTVFNERYEPVIFSGLTFRHQTKIGSVIPRLNYTNRNGVHGLQYDIDFYPKFLKKFYAYLNYGYSNSPVYPNHKLGGDVYMNLPSAIELSAGGRYVNTATRDIVAITNSLGYYKGNYYFSLRSYVSPREADLWSVSGNLLVRKYLRDGENFLGLSVGLGFTPELRQNFSGEQLLAETVLFVESQRLNFQYQFTPKKSPNLYRANLGVRRQELAFDSGQFFWAISGGLTYEVKF